MILIHCQWFHSSFSTILIFRFENLLKELDQDIRVIRRWKLWPERPFPSAFCARCFPEDFDELYGTSFNRATSDWTDYMAMTLSPAASTSSNPTSFYASGHSSYSDSVYLIHRSIYRILVDRRNLTTSQWTFLLLLIIPAWDSGIQRRNIVRSAMLT